MAYRKGKNYKKENYEKPSQPGSTKKRMPSFNDMMGKLKKKPQKEVEESEPYYGSDGYDIIR
jgi:hypothetical protein